MFDLDALGLAGRTGGENHVGEVIRAGHDAGESVCSGSRGRARDFIHANNVRQVVRLGRGSEAAHQFRQRRFGDDRFGPCILEDKGQPLLRIGGVQRHVRPAALEYPQHPRDHFRGPLHAKSDHRVGPDAPLSQSGSNPAGL